MASGTLLVDNANNITVLSLRVKSTAAYISDATISAALYDPNGTVVPGASAVTLSYTSGSNGEYRGIISRSVQITAGLRYKVVARATNYDWTRHAFWMGKEPF